MTADDKDPSPASTAPVSTGVHELLDRMQLSKRRVLLLVYHRDGVETVALAPGASVVVGREPPADIVVADPSLSRRHARFELVGGDVVVEDLGSTNGTLVGGQRIERATLKLGDVVVLGALTASVHAAASGERGALGLEGHDAFRDAVDAEIQRSRYFSRPLAVLMILSPRQSHLRKWTPRLRELLRPIDRAGVYSAEAIEVLLPEATLEQAVEIGRALVDVCQGDPALVCGVASYPAAATTADKLIAVSRDAARPATGSDPVRVAPLEGARTWTPSVQGDADLGITTESPRMRAVVDTAVRLGRSTIPVLLQGETGTGKELLSRLVHGSGPRRERPMICVNCGAIPAQLVESTLFGHERGAFTGATQQQKGVFEAADGGTVLLDEIGELPAAAQAALLRVLETKRVTRIGSTKELEVDVRVLAATHRDLETMCEAGSFRTDLLYRLNAMTLSIPPLRERREDIAPLAMRFLAEASESNDCHVRAIEPEAIALLEGYGWPGNVRELKNAMERAVVIAEGDTVLVRDLPERIRAAGGATLDKRREPAGGSDYPPPMDVSAAPAERARSFRARMEQLEAEVIVDALREANGNQTEAAKILTLPLRTLQHKIKALGIKRLGYAPPKG